MDELAQWLPNYLGGVLQSVNVQVCLVYKDPFGVYVDRYGLGHILNYNAVEILAFPQRLLRLPLVSDIMEYQNGGLVWD